MDTNNSNSHPYYQAITKAIQDFNGDLTVISNLKIIAHYNFRREFYDDLLSLLKENKIEEANKKYYEEKKTFEDLTLVSFHDKSGILWHALIYDSDELWQNPEVLEIFHPVQITNS
jgi:hypothetical protein